MSGLDDGPTELDLAGYVALGEHGFALPCFANGPRPNTWYTAVCSVSGDHLSTIGAFELFASDEIRPVAPNLIRRMRIGDPWCDVFLWKSEHHVGAPDELWTALTPVRDQIASRAPISLLDLGMCASSADRAGLARNAFDYVRGRFGDEKAVLWRRDTFLRQRVILYLQRLIHVGELSAAPEAARAIEIIERDGGSLTVTVPERLRQELVSSGNLKRVSDELQAVAAAFSLMVSIPDGAGIGPDFADAPTSRDAQMPAPISSGTEQPAKHGRADVLIVILGARAEQIARHLSNPDWLPAWTPGEIRLQRYGVKQFLDGRFPDDETEGDAAIHVVYERSELPPLHLHRYGVLVAIVDDDLLVGRKPSGSQGGMLDRLASEDGAIRVLVPALPLDCPARAMSTELTWAGQGRASFNAVLDTATARSPFWSGNPRRALDRRIADIVVSAALLCTRHSPLSEFLSSGTSSLRLPLLTFALEGPRKSGARGFELNAAALGMASEASWVRQDRTKPRQLTRFSASFHPKWFGGRRAGWATRGTAEIREGGPDFENFSLAILHEIDRPLYPGGREFAIPQSVPNELTSSLRFPGHVCGIALERELRSFNLVLIAETPDLGTVKAAARKGWTIARYTDQETISEVLWPDPTLRRPVLPREVRLSNVRRLVQNRRLATRGIDPRDVIRLSEDQLNEWRRRTPSGLLGRVRRYRASIESQGDASGTAFVLPLADIMESVEAGDTFAKEFARKFDVKRSALSRSRKRPADLKAAWASPRKECMRFVIADGVLPIVLALLERDEVPAQKLFIVDGDAAVPALFQSRVFEVWARATLSRSTSWMSRFSITGTFETFPVVQPFKLELQSTGSSSLMLRLGDKKLYGIARKWLDHINDGERSEQPTELKPAVELLRHPLRRRLDAAILDVYGLSPEASDLAILERLLIKNSKS